MNEIITQDDEEILQKNKLIRFHRLLAAMERLPRPEKVSWRVIVDRADLLQNQWDHIGSFYEKEPSIYQDIDARVRRVVAETLDFANQLKEINPPKPSVLEQIFANQTQRSFQKNDFERKEEEVKKLESHTEPVRATKTYQGQSNDVQDLEKTQRDQIENAISQMAAQMKNETERIHTTLKGQAQKLDQMEEIATDNVNKLTKVSTEVKDHVSKSWIRTVGTWTMIFTMIGAFVFTMIAIQVMPKRKGACLFCSTPSPDQFCRTLPSGKRECITLENKKEVEYTPEPEEVDEEYYDEDEMARSCEVDMYGNCIDEGPTSYHDTTDNTYEEAIEEEDSEDDDEDESDDSEAEQVHEDIEDEEEIEEGDLSELASMPPAEQLRQEALRDYYHTVEASKAKTMEKHLPPKRPPQPDNDAEPHYFDKVSDDKGAKDEPDPFDAFDPVDAIEVGDDTNDFEEEKGSEADFQIEDVIRAASHGDVESLKRYLSVRPDYANVPDANKWTPFHIAVRKGNEATVETMLAHGADPQLRTNAGMTALELAKHYHGPESRLMNLFAT